MGGDANSVALGAAKSLASTGSAGVSGTAKNQRGVRFS